MFGQVFTILLALIENGKDVILQTTIKAINDRAGLGGIIPILLVFGILFSNVYQ